MPGFIRKEYDEFLTIARKVPSPALAILVLSVVSMNLLANKELFHTEWIALDCGFVLSWIPFLIMDCTCKTLGGKAAAKISLFAITVNLLTFAVFKLISLAPGMWGEYYSTGLPEVNESLNRTIGGSTWIVLGSALAMAVASIVNSIVNMTVASMFKKDRYREFALRSFISTGAAQIVDNFTFATIVSIPLFGWTWKQTIMCSVCAAGFELLLEICFSGVGYRMAKKWQSLQ